MGVAFYRRLKKFSSQVNQVVMKANKVLNKMYFCIQGCLHHKIVIIPLMFGHFWISYASTVWNPHLMRNISNISKRRANNLYHLFILCMFKHLMYLAYFIVELVIVTHKSYTTWHPWTKANYYLLLTQI